MSRATVVGSGPNGLAAAITLARAGISVTVLEATDTPGGGCRSSEMLAPGLIHDDCAATHPMAIGSSFLTSLDLARRGVRWLLPEVDCVHPLDDGSAGVLYRSIDLTALQMGRDGNRWRALFGYPSRHFDTLAQDITAPLLRVPRHPIQMARFGLPAALPASAVGRLLRTESARALYGGVAAHAFRPLHYPMTAAVGLGIMTAGHRYGWPVVSGGTGSLVGAMTAALTELGATVHTGVRIDNAAQLPDADVTLFDLEPGSVAKILGERLPARVFRALTRFRHGPGAFKVDFAIDGGVPWTNVDARRAGTVHLGGTYAELASTERQIHAGTMPERPFVLVGQQYLADPQRSAGTTHPLWTYAHVPSGYTGDATEAIIGQIERFAPGFRERILGTAVRSTTELSRYNANYVDGDIMTGAKDIRQLVFGPRITLTPYGLGTRGMFICSAATPPGPGAHGMCGVHAANAALAEISRR
ncbi:phytoene desaturase family protein [Mycobacteroides saopaulense]|uniref:FAD-dependent oxidoreductase n=1 Tax=Mycobacteroides saopaulense TaxID=1578165 RepID=A0ABX3C2E0_9MYCO|nr:NAD(P)/FAD-dependent oxidoreductase [Mycobacteroides saopaulense]OHT85008.1 FAD-dependent oxidoreductase [Mycobacteroides saopaulense]OHU11160.1 FAD-dependent oxidoreductase [Mycobacteroides saopaulense]